MAIALEHLQKMRDGVVQVNGIRRKENKAIFRLEEEMRIAAEPMGK